MFMGVTSYNNLLRIFKILRLYRFFELLDVSKFKSLIKRWFQSRLNEKLKNDDIKNDPINDHN